MKKKNSLMYLYLDMFFGQSRVLLPAGVLLGGATIACAAGLLGTANYLLAAAALQPPVLDLMVAIVGVRFFGIARAVLRYLERYVTHDQALRIVGKLRSKYYAGIEPQAPAVFGQTKKTDFYSGIVSDISDLQDFYLRAINPILVAIFVLAAGFSFLAAFSQLLAVCFALSYLLICVVVPFAAGLVGGGIEAELLVLRKQQAAGVDGFLGGLAEIIAYDAHDNFQGTINKMFVREEKLKHKQHLIKSAAETVQLLMSNFALMGFVFLSGLLVAWGELSKIAFFALNMVAFAGFEAASPLVEARSFMEKSNRALKIFAEIWQQNHLRPEAPKHKIIDGENNVLIEMDDVWFRYAADLPWVLKGVSFTLHAGEKKAIMGASGVGKSSIIGLLHGFYQAERGTIRIAGRKIETLTQDQLTAYFSVAEQDAHFFNASLESNVRLANPGATAAEFAKAEELSLSTDIFDKYKDRMKSTMGEDGVAFSGGEKRRLAIMRCLLNPSPVMIFDEPGAGLDGNAEEQVLCNIMHLDLINCSGGVLLITHRLVGLEQADEIIVLHAGQVAERGCRQELMAANGEYSSYEKLSAADAV